MRRFPLGIVVRRALGSLVWRRRGQDARWRTMRFLAASSSWKGSCKDLAAFVGLAETNPTSSIGCNDSLEGSMPTVPYPCEARSIDAFLAQVVRYVSSGHYFYIRCRIPDGKDPRAVDEKIVGLYDVHRPRWQRKRRNLKTTAGIHYLRCGRLFVVMLTKGTHEAFYRDHASSVLDIRRTALKAFGYSIRRSYSENEKRWRVFVRLDKETYRKVKAHMLTVCTWPAFRARESMEQQFRALPYQAYCAGARTALQRRQGGERGASSYRPCAGRLPMHPGQVAYHERIHRLRELRLRVETDAAVVRRVETCRFPGHEPSSSRRRTPPSPVGRRRTACGWKARPSGAASGQEMATSVKCLQPAATAEKIATRSAQIVSPREAFSTLQPEKTFPSANTAAPTRKCE